MTDPDQVSAAREYYAAIDAREYDRLAGLLAPGFTQVRGDQTLAGREAFVAFMREGRPSTDTTHLVDETFVSATGDRVAVRGRLVGADGTVAFGFVDVFTVEDARLSALTTYTNRRVSTGDGGEAADGG